MTIDVRPDDLSSPEVQALVAEHLAAMHGNSPPGHVHALALDGLRATDVTFLTAWCDGQLCGCGALKALGDRTGEVKSMRTRTSFLRRGVGQAVLDVILQTARDRGYTDVFLETGTGEAFEAAHALYLRNGFEWCGPFADYTATAFNVFMVKPLATPAEPSPEHAWHRATAMQCNNRAWELSVQARTPEGDHEMLTAAHASAYHWAAVGTELHRMRAVMLLAEVYALVGVGSQAFRLASQMRDYFVARAETPDWELAFAHTIHAHAAAAAGRKAEQQTSYELATAAVAAIADPEDRAIVMQTFLQVPKP